MATSTLTLQAATAANFDTGWTQTVGNTWTSTSLVLTVTGAGSIQLTVSLRDDDSTGEVYKQVVPWSASGTLTIPLPTPLYGQIRVKGDVVAAGGTVAVAISGDLGSVTSSDGTTQFPGPVSIVEPNATASSVPRLVAKFSMATNSAIPTAKTELAVTVDGGGWFGIPKNTLSATNNKKDARIKLAFGLNAPQPDRGCTITVETDSGVVVWKVIAMPRIIGRNPSDVSQCLEIDGWVRGNGGTATNIDLQSHFEWRLLGYQTTVVNDDWQLGDGAWEQYLTASGFDSTIDNPLKVYIQWDAAKPFWGIKAVSTRAYGMASESGCFVRSSNRGAIVANPMKTATFAELDGNIAYGLATDGLKTVIVGAAGYIAVSIDGGKAFVPNLVRYVTQDLHDVVWCEGLSLWVAVGNAGTIITSPDGRVWTTRTSGASADIWKVKYNATAGVVAVAAAATNNVLRSANGTSWTPETLSTAFSPRAIALNAGNILVAGTGGNIGFWNGSTWTFSTAGASTFLGAVYNFSRYTLVGSAGTLYHSANGTTGWTAGTWTGGNTQSMYDIDQNGVVTAACGNGGLLYSSTDGITFTKVASANSGYVYGDIGRLEI